MKFGNSSEDVVVFVGLDSLDRVSRYIAEQGISYKYLLATRQYGFEFGLGLWSNGSAGFIHKVSEFEVVDVDEHMDDAAVKGRKYKCLSNTNQDKFSDMFVQSVFDGSDV